MKTKISCLLNAASAALLVATLLASSDAQAQTPTTYAEVPGRVFRGAALIDPFSANPSQPNIFFGGPANDNGGCSVKLIVPNLAESVCADADYAAVVQINHDPASGLLYSVGTSWQGNIWQVRASADEGTTWGTVNTFSLGSQSSNARGIAFDGLGNAFVCGLANDAAGDSHWIVRKRDNTGTWTTIRDWSERRKTYAADKMHISNGYLFVVGQVADKWAVQRLNLSNNTWDAPFTWAPKGKPAGAVAVTSWGSDVYVLGWTGGVPEASEQCVLQHSSNYGTGPWQTVKTFAESIQVNWPTDLTFDSLGNLYIVGHSTFFVPVPGSTKGKYVPAWMVRTHAAQFPITDGWQSSPLPPVYDQPTYARAICPDAFGNVFVVGQVDTYSGSTFSSRNVRVQKWTMP